LALVTAFLGAYNVSERKAMPERNASEERKRSLGRYFTEASPFSLSPFKEWMGSIPNASSKTFVEPFAGANGIIALMRKEGYRNPWRAYDIDPPVFSKAPDVPVEKRDCFDDFPDCPDSVIVTNPPYLAKNSASRRHIPFPPICHAYEDEYEYCLERMLSHCGYVAAIIPESFLTSGLFLDRIHSVVSLPIAMFSDTEVPVCLAMFSPKGTEGGSFPVYRLNELIGRYANLKAAADGLLGGKPKGKWVFNDPSGPVGVVCVDGTSGDGIRFVQGSDVDPSLIKASSRTRTRVSTDRVEAEDVGRFLAVCNGLLAEYRKETGDVFMTSFKGLRKDGKYRRRLDFALAKRIMARAADVLEGKE
jgi:hypothetical protein